MTERQEIPKKVKREVFERAGGPHNVSCEGCGLILGPKRFEYDHTEPEWLKNVPVKDRPPITADDVKLLGAKCCHQPKTAKEAGQRAHSDRLIDKQARAEKPRSRPMPGSRQDWRKQRLDGVWVNRKTGEPI